MNINNNILEKMIGREKVEIFNIFRDTINSKYDMELTWNNGGKKWDYEYKFRKGSKTLCAFYFRDNCLGLMIIFGRDERSKVDLIRNEFSRELLEQYDNAEIFHDGKWVMFDLNDLSLINDIEKLLLIKRKPNRK